MIETNILHLGDNIEVLKTFPDNSVDCIITDSPYGLGKEPDAMKVLPAWVEFGYYAVSGRGFMGKKWDSFVPQPLFWKECYRVLKPGCYCLSFFGTRTYDWGVMAMRLAGFQVRDQIDWIYGSGFPKSKACLKPAHEPIAVCRKPGPTIMLNIDECRIELNGDFKGGEANRTKGINEEINNKIFGSGIKRGEHDNSVGRWPSNVIFDRECSEHLNSQSGILNVCDKRKQKINHGSNGHIQFTTHKAGSVTPSYNDTGGASRFFKVIEDEPTGRWPANVIVDEQAADKLDEQSGVLNTSIRKQGSIRTKNPDGVYPTLGAFKAVPKQSFNDAGGASRFFYVAKASPSERAGSKHPTIKPLKLIMHLVKLFCPEGGICLDPHEGQGTHAEACILTNRPWIGIDNDPVSIADAEKRVSKHNPLINKNA
jgi:site-specific DNA-methyltransferase (adenine-specific)